MAKKVLPRESESPKEAKCCGKNPARAMPGLPNRATSSGAAVSWLKSAPLTKKESLL
jgi:hypothetical protein